MNKSDDWMAVASVAPYANHMHLRQITMLAPHDLVFLQARCFSWRLTNSVKVLKVFKALII